MEKLEATEERLAANGMLVKRPMVITDDKVLAGFQETEWEALL